MNSRCGATVSVVLSSRGCPYRDGESVAETDDSLDFGDEGWLEDGGTVGGVAGGGEREGVAVFCFSC